MKFVYDTIGSTYDACQWVRGVIPTNGVYRTAFTAELTALGAAAAGTVLGARSVKPDSGNARVFVGSAGKIEELDFGAIQDVSKSGGYTATGSWWFSQGVGPNEVVAATLAHTIQKSSGGNFSDLANAPKALIVLTQSEALLALNYIDGATSVPNGIKISDRGDSTVWTASDANDAAAIRLVETPGGIAAGATLNDLVVAWKRDSMYVGRFVGGAEKWQFNLLSPHIGCYGLEAWASTPAGIIFAGPAGVYLFDGSVPREVDQGVRQLILNYIGSENSYGSTVKMSHDEYSSCVFLWIPDADGQNFLCFAYNYREGRWSLPYPMYDRVGNATYDFGTSGVSDLQAVVRDLTSLDFLKIAGSGSRYAGHFVIPSDKKVYNLSGYSSGTPYKACSEVLTGRFKLPSPTGTDVVLKRIYPKFAAGFLLGPGLPSDLKCQVGLFDAEHYERNAAGNTVTATWDNTYKRFDVFATGKVFEVRIYSAAGTGFSINALDFEMAPAGKV